MTRGEPTALGAAGTLPLLTDTPARADFWRYMCERQTIYDRRASGAEPPWTDDETLRKYHFTNVYRELDKGTAYFHAQRAGMTSPEEILWSSIIYRTVNRLDAFHGFGGIPNLNAGAADNWLRFLDDWRADGKRIFTKRHQTRGLPGYHKLVGELLDSVTLLWRDVWVSATPEPVVVTLKDSVFGLGSFFAYQVYLDLLEAGLLEHVEGAHRYAVLGLGSTNALKWMYEGADPETLGRNEGVKLAVATHPGRLALVQNMTNYQEEAFADLGLAFPYHEIPSRDLRGESVDDGRLSWLRVKDIEHSLCEYLRYGLARGGTRGRLTTAEYLRA